MKSLPLKLALFVVILILWEGLGRLGVINPFLLPEPSVIGTTFWAAVVDGSIFLDVFESTRRVFIGFAISSVVAIPLGILLSLSKMLRLSLFSVLNFLRPIPPIAWIPLTILWFGIGDGPAYFLTMVASFFPVLINTMTGMQRLPEQYLVIGDIFGLTTGQKVKHIIIPSILPYILSGLRIGFGISWMAVVAAEMIASSSGLGYLIHVSQDMLRTDRVIVGMIVIGVLGLIFDRIFLSIVSHFTPWNKENAEV